MDRTERNLWSAFIDESKANRSYLAYAAKAEEEGLPEIAEVFREAAEGETRHALTHFQTMGEVKTTLENLRKVIEDEAAEFELIYPRFIAEAEAEGRLDAVASFRLALAEENGHRERFQMALEKLEAQSGRNGGSAAATTTPPAPTEEARKEHHELHTEKSRIASLSRIREVIFGMQDGLLTTATLGAAVAGATTSSHTVVVAGLAGALGGMLSMSAGSFLGSRAEREVHESELSHEAREIQRKPAEELAELVEAYRHEGFPYPEATEMADRVASDPDTWLRTMAEKELGLNTEVALSPSKDALAMGSSFIVGAMLPLFPYFALSGAAAVVSSVLIALVALFTMGYIKGKVVKRNPLYSGAEITAIGSAVAAAGYFLGRAFPA